MLSVFLENIVLDIPPVILRICCDKSAPNVIWIKVWLKEPKWASWAQFLFSAYDIDIQMVLR